MYRLDSDFYSRLQKSKPTVYVVISTHMTDRVFSGKALTDSYNFTTNSVSLLAFDRLQKTLTARKRNLLSGFASKRQNTFKVSLNNSDRKLGALMIKEPFITRPLLVKLGFSDLDSSKHFTAYSGIIDEVKFTLKTIDIKAVED